MSLHELDMAQKISDIIMCVKDHHVVKVGPPNEVFTRDRIHALYDLTNGSFNPAFGSVEMGKPSGDPKVFVIAGGGTGISTYRALQKQNMPFVTGVLHRNDIDFQLAEALASQVIAVDSFSEISDSELNHAISHMQSCDVVINCLADYGQMNQKNKVLVETAVKLGANA